MRTARGVLARCLLGGALLGLGLPGAAARAACNAIPDPSDHPFRGWLGALDTPLGRPDAPQPAATPDPRIVEVAPNDCHPSGVEEQDYYVVVLFEPPRGAAKNMVFLSAKSDCAPLSQATCDAQSDLHCVCGTDSGVTADAAADRVRFRFPDTSFAGPATVAVLAHTQPLPVSLRTQRCRDLGTAPAGVFACVDEIFATACGSGPEDLHGWFPHFTGLPATNDWRKLCEDPPGGPVATPACQGQASDLRFAVDRAGNALVPVRWDGILDDAPGGQKKKRGIEGRTSIPREAGGNERILLPSDDFLASFTPRGGGWPAAPEFGASDAAPFLVLTGTADQPESVLRIERSRPWAYECQGGNDAGQACHPGGSGDCSGGGTCVARSPAWYFACDGGKRDGAYCTRRSDCPAGNGCLPVAMCHDVATGQATTKSCKTGDQCTMYTQECGRGLFEFRDRQTGGVGPVPIPPGQYKARARQYE